MDNLTGPLGEEAGKRIGDAANEILGNSATNERVAAGQEVPLSATVQQREMALAQERHAINIARQDLEHDMQRFALQKRNQRNNTVKQHTVVAVLVGTTCLIGGIMLGLHLMSKRR